MPEEARARLSRSGLVSAEADLAVGARARLRALDQLQALDRGAQQKREEAQAGVLRAQLQQLLLGVGSELDGGGHAVGVQLVKLALRQALVGGLLDQLLVEPMGGARGLRVGVLVLLEEELDDPGRVGEIVLTLDQAEGPLTASVDVEPPVAHPLEHLLDVARAPDRLELLIGKPDDAELPLRRAGPGAQALLDHSPVAILEDVQGNALRWQRHDPEREQRKASG